MEKTMFLNRVNGKCQNKLLASALLIVWLGVCPVFGQHSKVDLNKAPGDFFKTAEPVHNILFTDAMQKCILNQLFAPEPGLPHVWLSGAGQHYFGQWIWDTMFMIDLLATMDVDSLIREDILENYWTYIDGKHFPEDQPYRDGMIPCMIMPAGGFRAPLDTQFAAGYSQIPIIAWGVRNVLMNSNDTLLLGRSLDYLHKFQTWYSTERDVNENGLIEFGVYPCPCFKAKFRNVLKYGDVQCAKFETFDMHAPMDSMRLTPHPVRGGGAYYGDVEGVEQTCFLIMSDRAMAEMYALKGDSTMQSIYEGRVAKRVKAVNERMWDPVTKFYYSLNRDTGEKIMRKTPQAFLTLTAGVATKQRAGDLVVHLLNPDEFWTPTPIPTLSRDDPDYKSNDFWRGDMWPAVNYLVTLGLNKYGYHDLARQLTEKTIERVSAAGYYRERIDTQTGKDVGAKYVGMSSSVLTMMIQDIYGVKRDYRTIRVPKDAAGKSLTLGKLQVTYDSDRVVNLQTGFERRFTVVFPGLSTATANLYEEGTVISPSDLVRNNDTLSFTAAAGKAYKVAIEESLTVRRDDSAGQSRDIDER